LASDFQIAIGTLLIAAVLWVLIFLIRPFDFWIMLASSTFVLLIIAIVASRKRIGFRASAKLVLYGVVVAVLLYGLFYFGYQVTKSSPVFSQGISAVYSLGSTEPSWVIAALLIFPIGPGEEAFWRGLVQRTFSDKMGPHIGLSVASIAYALVHVPTFNPPLILTALIGGLVWGALYEYTKSIIPGMVSHVLWDVMIFVIVPLR